MKGHRVCASLSVVACLHAAGTLALAQTTLALSPDVVSPGAGVPATVTGPPGQFFAVIGSSVGSGLSYGGVALGAGPDFAILAQGTLDGTGQVVITIVPPFRGTVLDRYYLQAATSPSPSFVPLSVSSGLVVRNAVLVTGLNGPPGPPGPAGATGPRGPEGLAGPAGATGAAGPAGPSGATGVTGPAGPTGPAGATGLTGPPGAAGLAGPTGATGMTGPAGVVATNSTGAFDFTSVNGFVAKGTLLTGALGATGSGVRMVWYPHKAAFRAGDAAADSWDDANIGQYSTATGHATRASGFSSVALGFANTASGGKSVALGDSSTASGTGGVALGTSSVAGGTYSVALGQASSATGDNATAIGAGVGAFGRASIAIGENLTASGVNSTALGKFASTNGQNGAFVYGDQSTIGLGPFDPAALVTATAGNQFVVRAAGGFRLRTSSNLSTGCDLPPGSGTWDCTSSRSAKHRARAVDGEVLLARLRGVPVTTWSYLTEPGDVRHIGPFAEDFRAAFGLGTSSTSIGLQDIDGVNFAAIQALDARTEALSRENNSLREELASLRALVNALAARAR